MEFKKNQKLYRKNKKTNTIEEVEIQEILYRLSKPVNNNYNHSAESLETLIKSGDLSNDYDKVKYDAIKQLEQQFGIKLKEV